MPEINLISAEQKRLSQTRNTVWLAVVIAGLGLVASLLAAAVVYSLRLVKKSEISQTENLIGNFQQEITGLSQIEQRQSLIHDRLDSSQKLLASRPQLQDRFDRLVNTFPAGVSIENLKIAGNDHSSEIAIESTTFAGFFDTLKILQAGGFSAVNFAGISRDKDGTYSVKMIITL